MKNNNMLGAEGKSKHLAVELVFCLFSPLYNLCVSDQHYSIMLQIVLFLLFERLYHHFLGTLL